MMEALDSFETPVLTRATRCNIPEDSILQCAEFVEIEKVLWTWRYFKRILHCPSKKITGTSDISIPSMPSAVPFSKALE
jgi:hypothetical protein